MTSLQYVSILAFSASISLAQTSTPELEARIEDLENKLNAIESQQQSIDFPELMDDDLTSVYGMGAAASKIYHVPAGVSIGGYGEALYTHDDDGTDTSDFLRAILYVGYKYNDNWILNTEIEFEHASTGEEGSASVEFATLDYLHDPAFNFRVGLLLIPVGIVNELHEPVTFLPVNRSRTETVIIPTTWRENGLGFFGEHGSFRYKAYIVNGLKGEDFTENGLRGGRQKGSKAESESLAGVLRFDWVPSSNIMVGGSVYQGDSGQSLDIGVGTTIVEAHAVYNLNGWDVHALIAMSDLKDVAALNRIRFPDEADQDIPSVGEEMLGWYVTVGYDVFHSFDLGEKALLPFVRYEEVNTQVTVPNGFASSGKTDQQIFTVGIDYRPIDELVFKVDRVTIKDAADGESNKINLSFGYVF